MFNKKSKFRFIAYVVVFTLLFTMIFVSPKNEVYANETNQYDIEDITESIIDKATNLEMKEIAKNLENNNTDKEDTTQKDANVVDTVYSLNKMRMLSLKTSSGNTPYYIDNTNGDDLNDGLSEGKAWKTFDNVNSTIFTAGDQILLKSGETWENTTLSPKGSGQSGNPIKISSYGGSNKPILKGNAVVEDVIYLCNQEYWEISNLDISNKASGFTGSQGGLLKDVRGIHIAGQDAVSGTLNNYNLHDLYIHDVTGLVNWISGDNSNDPPGIVHKSGWDGSKRTGGIVFEILKPLTTIPTTFEDIKIERNVMKDNSFGSIIIKQWNGNEGSNERWAQRDEGNNNFAPHNNIIIRDNYLSQYNSDYACNTIYLTSSTNTLIEKNVSAGAGVCGIEMYYTDKTTVQYNEVFDTVARAGGADSNAIDPDKEATNALIQYNYIHNTGDGILLCGFIFGDSVVRYNVIKDAEKRYINPHADKGSYLVYNNILYNTQDKSSIDFISSSGGNDKYLNDSNCFYKFYNNIFYNKSTTSGQKVIIGTGTGVTYSSNSYFGNAITVPESDLKAVLSDPLFAGEAPNTRGTEQTGPILNLDGLKLKAGSANIEAGEEFATGEKDFFGNNLYNELPDIGIAEYQGSSSGTETIMGYVTDSYGNAVSNVNVSIDTTAYSATSNEYGFYSIIDVPCNTYSITTAKNGYENGAQQNVSITNTNVKRQDLKIGSSLSNEGNIAGNVKDYDNNILDGADISITVNGNNYSAVTDLKGNYIIENIPIGVNYTVTASKYGYTDVSQDNINVQPQNTTKLDFKLTKLKETRYVIDESFDNYETGNFTDQTLWTIEQKSGKIDIVDNEDTGKSLFLERTLSDGGMTRISKAGLNLSGIITMETRIKKTGTGYFCLPFLYSKTDASNPVVTVIFENGEIKTHINGKNIEVVMPYSETEWYDIKLIVNTDTGLFDLYINNEIKLKQKKVRNAKADVDKVTLYAEKVALGQAYVDYFRICEGVPYEKDDAVLKDIKVSGVDLIKKDALTYEGSASSSVSKVTVIPTANSSRVSSVKVNNVEVGNGNTSSDILLEDDTTVITVTITAEDGITSKTYTINIKKIAGDIDAYLTNIIISSGILNPVFDTNIFKYNTEVPYSVDKINLTATTSSPNANVKINSQNEVSGTPSKDITLVEGENTINIEVTSGDGTETIIYTVVVKRGEKPVVEKLFIITGMEVLERKSGIKASATVDLINEKSHDGNEYIVFELFKSNTPINIIAIERDIINTENMSVYFNVDDFENKEYSVKVFVFDSYDTEGVLPVSLANPVILN